MPDSIAPLLRLGPGGAFVSDYVPEPGSARLRVKPVEPSVPDREVAAIWGEGEGRRRSGRRDSRSLRARVRDVFAPSASGSRCGAQLGAAAWPSQETVVDQLERVPARHGRVPPQHGRDRHEEERQLCRRGHEHEREHDARLELQACEVQITRRRSLAGEALLAHEIGDDTTPHVNLPGALALYRRRRTYGSRCARGWGSAHAVSGSAWRAVRYTQVHRARYTTREIQLPQSPSHTPKAPALGATRSGMMVLSVIVSR